jgi:hypothetical protein
VAEGSFGPEWRAFGRARYLAAALPRLEPLRRDALHDEILGLVAELPEASLRRDVLSLLATKGEAARFEEIVEVIEAESDAYERGLMAGFVIDLAPEGLRGRLVDAALADFDQIGPTESQSVTERVDPPALTSWPTRTIHVTRSASSHASSPRRGSVRRCSGSRTPSARSCSTTRWSWLVASLMSHLRCSAELRPQTSSDGSGGAL